MKNQTCLVGEPCSKCGFEMMEISKESLQKCVAMNVAIHSIPKALIRKLRAYTPVCPRCEVYALGIEMVKGLPFRDKNGEILTVHDLGEDWLS